MKRMILLAGVVILGTALGSGAAYGTGKLLAGEPLIDWASAQPDAFVPTGSIVAPLVADDGHLLGYMSFEAQLQVPADQVDHVKANLPLLLDATTLRTFKAPIAGGKDGLIPKLTILRAVLTEAVEQTYGPTLVSHVAITQATML